MIERESIIKKSASKLEATMDTRDNRASWGVIDKYFYQGGGADAANPLVAHQVDSFNEFIDKKIPQVISGFNPIQIFQKFDTVKKDFTQKISISLLNPSLGKPTFQLQDGTKLLMTPHLARMNHMTYCVALFSDVHIVTDQVNDDGVHEKIENTITGVPIGKIPVMIRSKACVLQQMPGVAEGDGKHECKYDVGGYFIVNGNEKVVISQDRISENKTLVFNANASDGMSAEIRSIPDNLFLPPKTTTLHLNSKANHLGRTIRLITNFIRSEIPVFTMFRALGVESDKDIIQHIVLDINDGKNQRLVAELTASTEDGQAVFTQDEALKHILRILGITGTPREYLEDPDQAKKILLNVIKNDFLPHVGPSFARKAMYLGYMVRKLLRIYLGYQLPDNRDSYMNKRIDTPGVLFGNLFRQCYGKMIKEMRNMVQRDLQLWRANKQMTTSVITNANVHRFFKQATLESGLKYALSTGNWGVKTLGGYSNIRQGVAQVLNRMSYLSTLSHERRINTPMEKAGKLVQPRKLDVSQFGMICPAETPEGHSVGLVKNLALSTTITTAMSSANLRKCVMDYGLVEINDALTMAQRRAYLKEMGSGTVSLVYINGDMMGFHRDPDTFYKSLKHMKLTGEVSPTTSIMWDVQRDSIFVSTEAGRMCRPVHVIDSVDGTMRIEKLTDEEFSKATFSNLMVGFALKSCDRWSGEGVIEYLDVEELDKAMVAMTPKDLCRTTKGTTLPPKFTHAEIHPSLISGVLAANIPFSDHNQAPRNCYQSSMGKQAVCTYMSNFNSRMDTMAHVLNYPQKALARTKLSKYTHSENLPAGINAVVAIMTYTGFNQEDSVMLNQSALDLGLFTSTYYKTYKDQCNKNHSTGEEEEFCIPTAETVSQLKPFNYGKLAEDGFVPINTRVGKDDIIVGKVMPQVVAGKSVARDTSIHMNGTDSGVIDYNYKGVNNDGYKFCKIRLRNYRKPQIGDKFSSRHGQKGSLGMTYKKGDMPFSKDGIVPDIIINPHAIPSRMTIGQLLECIMGKAACGIGSLGDATPFTDCSVNGIGDVLESCGMERHGNEILYNGRTGEQIHTEIFIGPTYYQRLKHMIVDKTHSRGSNGPVTLLTRQPAEGRSKCGGLRLGEMEVHALISHAASGFLKERMMDSSDNYRVFICRKCGLIATANPDKNIYKCSTCKTNADFAQVRIPYACKLLFQELETLGVAPRITV
jgi:DNA-directed RNA polymerase II subunit RPB2